MNEREQLFEEARKLGLSEVYESPGNYSNDELRMVIAAARSTERIVRLEDRVAALEEQMDRRS